MKDIKKFLAQYDITPMKALKVSGAILLVVVVLGALSGTRIVPTSMGVGSATSMVGKMAPMMDMDGYGYDDYAVEESYMSQGMGGAMLSSRNIAPVPTPGGNAVGDGEAFEVTDYNATIETNNSNRVCDVLTALKPREDIIFERANTHDKGCDFGFKVELESVDDVLAIIEGLNPRDLSENTYTIKRQIDDFTSEEDILSSKLSSIDETLTSALAAYEDITALATRTNNAEALATIIDSRVGVIERLSQERINVSSQLERLARAKEEQLDRLTYAYFNVSVYERSYFDGEEILDSWKQAVRDLVYNVNRMLQDITLGLIALALMIIQYAIYLAIILLIIKYGWRYGKKLWEM